jgi:hypothetical protein
MTVKKLLEGNPGGETKKLRSMNLGVEEYGCKQMYSQNKSFRQNRMGICLEGSQGQAYRAIMLKKKKKKR